MQFSDESYESSDDDCDKSLSGHDADTDDSPPRSSFSHVRKRQRNKKHARGIDETTSLPSPAERRDSTMSVSSGMAALPDYDSISEESTSSLYPLDAKEYNACYKTETMPADTVIEENPLLNHKVVMAILRKHWQSKGKEITN